MLWIGAGMGALLLAAAVLMVVVWVGEVRANIPPGKTGPQRVTVSQNRNSKKAAMEAIGVGEVRDGR